MTFTMRWSDSRAEFVYADSLGAVVLRGRNHGDEWQPDLAVAHRPAGPGDEIAVGECQFVSGPCHIVEIEDNRTTTPIQQWVRHQNDPKVVERVLRLWYEEFVDYGH